MLSLSSAVIGAVFASMYVCTSTSVLCTIYVLKLIFFKSPLSEFRQIANLDGYGSKIFKQVTNFMLLHMYLFEHLSVHNYILLLSFALFFFPFGFMHFLLLLSGVIFILQSAVYPQKETWTE